MCAPSRTRLEAAPQQRELRLALHHGAHVPGPRRRVADTEHAVAGRARSIAQARFTAAGRVAASSRAAFSKPTRTPAAQRSTRSIESASPYAAARPIVGAPLTARERMAGP